MPIELNEKIRDEADKIDEYLMRSTEGTLNMFKRIATGKTQTQAQQCSEQLSALAGKAIDNFADILRAPVPPVKPSVKPEPVNVQRDNTDIQTMFEIIGICENLSIDLGNEDIDAELRYKLELALYEIHKKAFDYAQYAK